MKTLTPDEYDALTRLDFWIFVQRVFAELTGETFLDNFHIQILCAEIDRVRTEPATRMAIALPPRSLKSIIISVALPAWLLGHNPGVEIVCASYGQSLSDDLATGCRQVMQSHWYQRLFPATRLERLAVGDLLTTQGGKRYATSVGGALTGIGADVIIVDDPMKPEEALSDTERARANNWARHTLFTRLNDKRNGRIVIVMQRLHEDDMIGYVSELTAFELLAFSAIAQEDEEHWIRTPWGTLPHTRLQGEALHPEREPLEVLEHQLEMLGSDFFAAQYLQSPTPPGGGLIKTEWFCRYEPANRPPFIRVIQSWDTGSKAGKTNDYSVCTTWGIASNGDIYLLHVLRERLEFHALKPKIREMAQTHNAIIVLIEDAGSGIQLIQDLRYDGFGLLQAVPPPRLDKATRCQIQTPVIEAGKVYIPSTAHWLSDWLRELEGFPNGRFDDQVDSMSQALAYIKNSNGPEAWVAYFAKRAEEEQVGGSY